MTNRLGDALSPYLRQHADNPVDWWQWCDEAFAEARRRDVPILLSVGYAACHWCHVMAHESFDDPGVAGIVNDGFVAIKVDREERPDIDALYMRATQLMTGQGGWPMTVFLDAEGRPFQAGTYYPPDDRGQLPSFRRVLTTITRIWTTDRGRVNTIAARMARALAASDGPAGAVSTLVVPGPDSGLRERSDTAVGALRLMFDATDGGFGHAPKFPPSSVLEHLLRVAARDPHSPALDMATGTLTAMARRGLYDQIGGGFARYSTDAAWVVPHFEKMLYDNALLARGYLHWWRLTGDPLAERITRETADFLIAELGTGQGGFASALDADSDPVLPGQQREGAFVVWTPGQVSLALSRADFTRDQIEQVCHWLAITRTGTFEHGTSVPQLRRDPDDPALWARARAELREARDQRPRPARDDKVVAGWNGLAIAALAEAGALLDQPEYLAAARDCADLLLEVHRSPAGWLRVSRDGRPGSARAALDDLAGMAEGLLALYQTTGEVPWLTAAGELLDEALARHRHPDGGFWDTPDDAEALLVRLRESSDNATPSGWSLITGALLSYSALTGSTTHRRAAEESLTALLDQQSAEHPRFFGWALAVLEAFLAGPLEVAVIGEGDDAAHLRRTALTATSPGAVVAFGPAGSTVPALLADRPLMAGVATAYVCQGFTCQAPTTEVAALAAQVGAQVGGGVGSADQDRDS